MALCSGVDGKERAGAHERHHEVAAHDDGLLVGVREVFSRLEGGKPGVDAGKTDKGVDHNVDPREGWQAA